MSLPAYVVRDYRPDDKERLEGLCADVWNDRPADTFARRWWWSQSRPPLKIAEDLKTRALVGFCGCAPFSLYFQNRNYPSAWFADFFISKEHQGKGLGRLLADAVTRPFELAASLNHNDAALSLFRKMGWHESAPANLYLNPWLAVPGARRFLARSPKKTPYVLKSGSWPLAAPGELDSLWNNSKDRWAPLACRDAAALERRYGPLGRDYKMLRCYKGDTLVGYMITRIVPAGVIRSLPAKPVGLIVDFLVQPGESLEIFRALLAQAFRQLPQDGAAFLMSLTTAGPFAQEFARNGFLHAATPIVGARLSRLKAPFAFAGPAVAALGPAPWFLTFGDADLDLMW